MVEEILSAAKKSTYDFRETAYPEDPLRHLFEDWVSYYRIKWAVARVLQPKNILRVTMVQERIRWFDQRPKGVYSDLEILCSAV